MKTLKLFSLLACMILCGLTANAQDGVKNNPDEAEYFIKGKFNIQKNAQGEVEYTLTNVSTKGITFDMKDVFEGALKDKSKEQILFEFENAKTDYNGGFENRDNRLQYWRKVSGIWQPDTETDQGGKDTTINSYFNIMLVLDCSNSLGSDFNSVKRSAEQFIEKLYKVAPDGNVRVGIIGFSTINNANNHAQKITPLNYVTKDIMIDSIREFPKGNGTALYYSLDQAVRYLEEDSRSIKEDDYLGSYIITFTDGIDQQSHDYNRDIFTADEYYENIKPILQGINRTKIYNKNIEHTIIALRGTDIPDAMVSKFEGDLRALCDEYIPLTNINELSRTFSQKAEDLINKSTKLQCYVSMGFQGEVGWTFGKKEPVVEYKPEPLIYKPEPIKVKKQNRFFLGINAGVGAGLHRGHDWYIALEKYSSFQYSLGLDMSFPINRTLSLGAFASVGMETSKVVEVPIHKIDVSIGPLVTLNFKNKSAFLFGAGLNIYKHSEIPLFNEYGEKIPGIAMINDIFNIGISSRIGWQFPSKFYIMGEFIFNENRNRGNNDYIKYGDDFYQNIFYSPGEFFCVNIAVLLHFGYRIF